MRGMPIILAFWVLYFSVSCLAQQASSLTSDCLALVEGSPSQGQQATSTQQTPTPAGTEDLQKATQNPVASLISVPIQNNSNFGIGPYDRIQNVRNIQPVIPIRASENWNLIIRWSAPII